ncbi:unnamed protein product [Eruca vesicaria subsp. sativa]|uniref:Leucine-rich repeat-containing N-terminal plant-type domain-containing protein n=1 Tax=Eruca vesicaria subsp. sativa TaxID=29727 RepID=A0ABC8LLS9_ERUVS|nr:unnamed protein product [Eruca vesicaria subsp. sativa]
MHSRNERKMIIWSLCLIFSLSYSTLVFSSPAKQLCRPDQRDALWEFKSEFHFSWMAPNEQTQRWINNTDCCSWDGISCDRKTGNVVDLNLWGSSLNGSLRSNSGLFKLQHLQSLNLSSNNLAGILPDSIGNLKYLRVLKLYGCSFFGKIPSSIGNLSHLTHLDLEGNGFTGELPESMGNLNKLTKLLLSTSKLSGNFHHALLNLSELTWFDLRSNHLEGNNLKISSSLHLLSPIGSLSLASCNVSDFPNFLQTQTNNKQERFMGISFSNYHKSVVLAIKGSEMELLGSELALSTQFLINQEYLLPDIPMSFLMSQRNPQYRDEILNCNVDGFILHVITASSWLQLLHEIVKQ